MEIRQRRVVGAILKIPIDDRSHGYCWTLPEVDFGVFDLRAGSDLPIEDIIRHPILFRVAVNNSAWNKGRWLRVGKAAPPPEVLAPVPTYILDPIDGRYSIYLLGDIRPATPEECVGLQPCEVWSPQHVEDRLRDHFRSVSERI